MKLHLRKAPRRPAFASLLQPAVEKNSKDVVAVKTVMCLGINMTQSINEKKKVLLQGNCWQLPNMWMV